MRAMQDIPISRRYATKRLTTTRLMLLLAAMTGASAVHALPQFFIVGDTTPTPGSFCQFATIQAALDAAEANGPDLDFVLITNTTPYVGQALVIRDQSVLIEGGFADCTMQTTGPAAVIVGNQAESVVQIGSSFIGPAVTLRHLDLSMGGGRTGGGLYVFGKRNVRIDNVRIHDNNAEYGGGIMSAFSYLDIGKDVSIADNTAHVGGGLYVLGGAVRIENDRTEVRGNRALYVPNAPPYDHVGSGGGIYARGFSNEPSTISVGPWTFQTGAPRPPISGFVVSDNRAEISGGGIFLDDAYVEFAATEMNLLANSAAVSSGAVAVHGGGTFQMSRDNPGSAPVPQCANFLQCNVIRDNTVDTQSTFVAGGGAIGMFGGTVRLFQTALLENVADSGAAITTSGVAGFLYPALRLQGVLVGRNHCRNNSPLGRCATIELFDGTDARISYATISDNTHGPGQPAAEISAYGAATTLKLLSSIVMSAPGIPSVNYGGGGAYQTDCVIANNAGLPPGYTRSDPMGVISFNDLANVNYSVPWYSPAVDYCDNANTLADTHSDIRFNPRGVDVFQKSNVYGTFDIGAYETPRPQWVWPPRPW